MPPVLERRRPAEESEETGERVREPGDLDPSKPPSGDWVRRREGPSGKLIALGVVVVLLLVFVLQNTDKAKVHFFFWHARSPIWLVIVLAAVLGFVGGWVVALLRRRRRTRPKARLPDPPPD